MSGEADAEAWYQWYEEVLSERRDGRGATLKGCVWMSTEDETRKKWFRGEARAGGFGAKKQISQLSLAPRRTGTECPPPSHRAYTLQDLISVVPRRI